MSSLALCFLLALTAIATAGIVWVVGSVFMENADKSADAYGRELSQTLEDLFLFVPAKRLVDFGWIAASVAFLVVILPFCRSDPPWLPLVGVAVASLAGAGAFRLPRLVVRYLQMRRRERFNLQLLEALPMMSNALRAGFSITQAFESVAEGTDNPMRQEVSLFLQQTRVGVPFVEALDALDKRVGSEDLTLVCTSIDIARRSGGNLTEVFDTIAETIRARLRIRQHVKTLTAQGRLQGLIIGAMPFLLGIGMAIFKPGIMLPFVCSLAGAGTLVAVVLLVSLGGWMIRKIITIDV